MTFNSYIFTLLFLPLSVIGYFSLNRFNLLKTSKVFLIGMSLWFYGYFNLNYLFIMIASIICNWFISRILCKTTLKDHLRKLMLLIGIIFNLGMIFYFKYFDFFLSNINSIFETDFILRNILLPLGISFYTFQQVSYVVDSFKGETKGYNFIDYALFVSFFPQLVAGPIALHGEMIPQFKDIQNKKINHQNLSCGIYFFAIGLFKKVMIADIFGKVVTYGYAYSETLTSLDAVVVMLCYTFQIYFDFSGYSDMAIGIGKMFNINLPANFNSPYKALSIIDFWDRWHLTLTRFLRNYVYFPLGGSRKGEARTYINILIVFFLSGLWHGATWLFILWGMLHGIFNVFTRLIKKHWDRMFKPLRWAITFIFVNLTWIIFRAETVEQLLNMLNKVIFLRDGFSLSQGLIDSFYIVEFSTLLNAFSFIPFQAELIMLVFYLVVSFAVVLFLKNINEIKFQPKISNSLITVLFLVWSIVSFSGVSTFLYFNF